MWTKRKTHQPEAHHDQKELRMWRSMPMEVAGHKSASGTLMVIIITIVGIVVCAAGLTAVLLYPVSSSGVQNEPQKASSACYCGQSVQEALKIGCKFDILAPAWLPDRCRDDNLTRNFAHSGPGFNGTWGYFADKNLTVLITEEEIGLMADHQERKFYTTWEWHMMHCLYMWQKQAMAAKGLVVLEERYDNVIHAAHCTKLFFDHHTTTSGVVLDSSLNPSRGKHIHMMEVSAIQE